MSTKFILIKFNIESVIMILKELRDEVFTAIKDRPSYIREGQAVFNYIDEVYGVAREVQFVMGVDCFYDDSRIEQFLYEACESINSHLRENNRWKR